MIGGVYVQKRSWQFGPSTLDLVRTYNTDYIHSSKGTGDDTTLEGIEYRQGFLALVCYSYENNMNRNLLLCDLSISLASLYFDIISYLQGHFETHSLSTYTYLYTQTESQNYHKGREAAPLMKAHQSIRQTTPSAPFRTLIIRFIFQCRLFEALGFYQRYSTFR